MPGLRSKSILVTGGCGHIGSYVVSKLLERGVKEAIIVDTLNAYPFDQLSFYCSEYLKHGNITFYKVDIAEREKLAEIFRRHKPDIVFHLAAYADVAATIYNPNENFRTNIIGTYNVLSESLKVNAEKYVFASSASVYGDQPWIGDSPPKFSEDMKPNPLSSYANAKLWGELEAMLYCKLYGLKTVSLRYFSVYGPKQIPKPKSHSWAVAIFAMRVIKSKPIVVYGGRQVRDFIMVEDVAEATVRAAEEDVSCETINIGTGRPTSILDLAQKIKMIFEEDYGIKAEIQVMDYRPKGDPLGGYADTEKMSKTLKFTPRYNLEDGLKKTIEWYVSNKELIPEYI